MSHSIQYLVVCQQSWDSSLGYVWAERFSVWLWQQQENVLLSRTFKQTLRPTKPSYSMATEGSFPGGVVRLITQFYLLVRLGMSGAIPLLPHFSALNFTNNTSCTSLMHDTLMGCVPAGSTLASSPQLPILGSNIK